MHAVDILESLHTWMQDMHSLTTMQVLHKPTQVRSTQVISAEKMP